MSNFTDVLLNGIKAVAPTLVSFIPGVGPIAGAALRGILDNVKIDKTESDEAVAARIVQDPALFAEIKMHAMNIELDIEKERTKRLEAVNITMQMEGKSESWWQRAWRPFNGFAFGITLFCDYFVSQIIIIASKISPDAAALAAGAAPAFTWDHIPAGIYMLWTTVLGVTAGSRGFEKITKTKTQNGGQLNLTDTLKTFLAGAIGKR